jgi:hypothetical protein
MGSAFYGLLFEKKRDYVYRLWVHFCALVVFVCRYHLDLCRNVFGEGVYPDVSMTNLYYGGTRIAGVPFD